MSESATPGDGNGDNPPLLDVRIAELGQAHGISEDEGTPMVEREDPWIHHLDGGVTVAINTDEPNTIKPEGCMSVDAKPFQMTVWNNGWVCYIGPENDRIVGGLNVEDYIINAIEEELDDLGFDYAPEASDRKGEDADDDAR